jgi:inhibitor of cysteine peptidase
VESVEIRILESMPVQVQVVATGYLADACTKMGEITQSRDGNTFNITIPTTRPADAACAEVITPFEEIIPLDVAGLTAGTYTVNVNGVTDTFELTADNVAP